MTAARDLRDLSRITLDVLSVRVERLHDISEEDARAEGVTVRDDCGCACACHGPAEDPGPHLPECLWHAEDVDPWEEPWRASFAALWRSINGAESWDANPWVWRIEFRRAETSEAAATPPLRSAPGGG